MGLRLKFFLFLLVVSCKIDTTSIKNQNFPNPDFFYMSLRNSQTIVLSDINGENQYPITAEYESPVNPIFASDGKYIIYSALTEGSKSRSIFKYNTDKMKRTSITDDFGNDLSPSISYDGIMLVFSSNRNSEGNTWNIFIMNLLTNKIKQVTQGTLHYDPLFSTDDSKILFSEYSNGYNHLSIIDTNGANYIKLESQKQFYSEFQFSSNADRIYYNNDRGIFSCSLDGSDKTIIVSDSSEAITCRFYAPVDSILFYNGYDYSAHIYRLYRLNIDTGEKRILKESVEKVFFEDCTPDGTKILFLQIKDGKGNIILKDLKDGNEKQITDSEYHDFNSRFNKFIF